MNQPVPAKSAPFKDIAVGVRFYDPISQEFFVKSSESQAIMMTGLGDGRTPDDFEPTDPVRV